MNALAYSYAQQNTQLEKALEFSQKALKMRPGDPQILDTQAWVLYHLNKYEEAESLIRQANEVQRDPTIQAHWIQILRAQQENTEADALLMEALEEYPEDKTLLELK
jgi:tetratricopeptide (TPR) repeat protein